MKAKNVAMLVRKDLRMSRGVFIAGVIIWTAPMLISIITGLVTGTPLGDVFSRDAVVGMLGVFGSMSLLLSVPMIVGHVVAAEEVDRSAAFLAYVPLTRTEAVMGKMICAVLLAGALLLLCAGIYTIDAGFSAWELGRWAGSSSWPFTAWRFYGDVAEYAGWVVPAMVVVFGSAWAAGAVVRRTGVATMLGMAIPFLLWSAIIVYGYSRENQRSRLDWLFMGMRVHAYYVWWSVVLGIALFVAGVVVFLRRKPEA
jgi:hypothetical protein